MLSNPIVGATILVVCAFILLRLWANFPPIGLIWVVLINMITQSISLLYLENFETYLIETNLVSTRTGAFERLVAYSVFIVLVSVGFAKGVGRLATIDSDLVMARISSVSAWRNLRWAIRLTWIVLGAQLGNALASPPYALPMSGVTRQEFWDGLRSEALAELIGVLVVTAPVVAGVAFAIAKTLQWSRLRRSALRLTAAYALYLLVIGQRFNGGLLAVTLWFGFYFTARWLLGCRPRIRSILLPATLFAFALVLISIPEIGTRGIADREGGAMGGLVYRSMALQGNIYYAADKRASDGERVDADLLIADMPTTIRTYMPRNLADSYIASGINVAGSLPGSSVLVFGFIGALVPLAVYGLILGLLMVSTVRIISLGEFLYLIPGAYLCLWTYSIGARGSFSPLMSPLSLVVIAVLALWYTHPGQRHLAGPRAGTSRDIVDSCTTSGPPSLLHQQSPLSPRPQRPT